MVTETEERANQQEETGQSSETKQRSADSLDSQTSDDKRETSAGMDFTSPAFRKAVMEATFSELQSRIDKAITPLRAENERLKREVANKSESRQDAADMSRWIDEGEDEGKVRSWADAKKWLVEEHGRQQDKEAELETQIKTATSKTQYAEAVADLISEIYPEVGTKLDDKIKYLISESEGNSKLRKRLAKDIAAEIRSAEKKVAEIEVKEQPSRRTDSGIPSPTPSGSKRVYTEAQVNDPVFFAAHKDDIYKAQEEGRIRYE